MKAHNLPPRVAVLASGRGSNFEALSRAALSGEIDLRVVCLVSNNADAPCLERASELGIPALVLPAKGLSREDYDRLLAERLASYEPDWVFLLGWMRILTKAFLSRFPGRVVNLHPALPGAFPGLDAIARAWEGGRRGEVVKTGVMLHLVPDEGVDDGPLLAVEEIAIAPSEDLTALEERMHAAERRIVIDFAARLGAVAAACAATEAPRKGA
jgi:phosphoribosylglycinamide formyltransferase-1